MMQCRTLFLSGFVLFVLASLPLISCVEASSELWSQTYDGGKGEYAHSLVETSDGGFALAGVIRDDYGHHVDCWLVKTDAYGNMEWNQTYNGGRANALIEASDGGYAIAGSTSEFGAGSYDCLLIKTDAYGNMEWNRTYGGINPDHAQSLVKTSDGGYAIAGDTHSFGAESYDFWLVKTDSNGNMEWNRTYGGTNHESAYSLVVTSDGGFALAGNSGDLWVGQDEYFWLVKTDAYGNMEWNQTYETGIAFSLVETSDKGFALAGGSQLVKTDAYGNMEWNQTYPLSARSLVVTSDGGYALAGRIIPGGSGNDFWLVKADGYGKMEWNQTYDGGVADSLIETSDSGYALAGYSGSLDTDTDFWLLKTDEHGIPEFPSWTIMPLLLVATLAVIIYKQRLAKKSSNRHTCCQETLTKLHR